MFWILFCCLFPFLFFFTIQKQKKKTVYESFSCPKRFNRSVNVHWFLKCYWTEIQLLTGIRSYTLQWSTLCSSFKKKIGYRRIENFRCCWRATTVAEWKKFLLSYSNNKPSFRSFFSFFPPTNHCWQWLRLTKSFKTFLYS